MSGVDAQHVRVAPTVQHALDEQRPVVALESTVYSTLGLPPPHNRDVLDACIGATRGQSSTFIVPWFVCSSQKYRWSSGNWNIGG